MQKLFKIYLMLVLLAIQLSSCITTRHTNYLQETKNFIPSYNDSVDYQDYLLKQDDRLFIQVYSLDEKTNSLFNTAGTNNSQILSNTGSSNIDLYTYVIQSNGCIRFPLIGDILLEGKTVRDAKETIENAVKPIMSVNSVDVRMVGRTFSIIGGGKSGKFTFPREKVNIYQAIAMAGDLGYYADRSKIKILRETAYGGNIIKTFDIRSINIINSEYYYLEPNDVIFIQPMKEQFFRVNSFWTALATVITTYSFGVIIYTSFLKK